jgi:hypothetical protein
MIRRAGNRVAKKDGAEVGRITDGNVIDQDHAGREWGPSRHIHDGNAALMLNEDGEQLPGRGGFRVKRLLSFCFG